MRPVKRHINNKPLKIDVFPKPRYASMFFELFDAIASQHSRIKRFCESEKSEKKTPGK